MLNFDTNDTIIAVSSTLTGPRKIIRIAGSKTFHTLANFISKEDITKPKAPVLNVHLKIDDELDIPAIILVFNSPNSYTGDHLAELHIDANKPLTDKILENFLKLDIRLAAPGEFTARAFLNGKMDLAQAEAVSHIISASNSAKLSAAQKLLAGNLSSTIALVRKQLLKLLSLIEAGLDFSEEDIEFITYAQAIEKINETKTTLEDLLTGAIHYEAVIEMPTVGIAGTTNAGKSSLINALLGYERSIVSETTATTRDILTGQLTLENNHCIIFDSAGLITEHPSIIDQLANDAAVSAIQNAAVILFCLDASKKDFSEDAAALAKIKLTYNKPVIPVLTKSDLLESSAPDVATKLFSDSDTILTSALNNTGLDNLIQTLDSKLTQLSAPASDTDTLAVNRRHVQTVSAAVENLQNAHKEIKSKNDELASMFIRNAYQSLSEIETEHIDEKLLENIFASFCIGK